MTCCTFACELNCCPDVPSAEKPTGVLLRAQSTLTKKNVLFLKTGPPTVNPYCLSWNWPTAASAGCGTAIVGTAVIFPIRLWLRPT